MTNKRKRSIAKRLNRAQVATSNTLADTEILNRATEYGFDETKMQAGLALFQTAQGAVNVRKLAQGDQQQATVHVLEAQTEAQGAYQKLAKVARAVLNKGELAALGLVGEMPRATAGFLAAGYALFDNAASQPKLAEYGYDVDRLAAGRAKIEAYDQANQAQEAAKGAAQQATQDQHAALDALDDWLARFIKIARVALADKPQLLEKLGIIVK